MSCWGLECCSKQIFRLSCGDGEIDLSTQAFGLPPKTIRAILAFIIVSGTFFCFIGATATFAIDGKYKLLLGTLTAMTNVMSASLGFYFGSRGSSKDKRKKILPPDIEMTEITVDSDD